MSWGVVEGRREKRVHDLLRACERTELKRARREGLQLAMEGQRGSAGGRRFGVVGLRGERQEREEIAAGQALEAEGFELLRGALFSPWQGLVTGLKRAPHIECMMPSVEGL